MELLYVVCQIAAAGVCEEHRTPLYGAGPITCVSSAQAELPRLVLPGWKVARWTCGDPARSEPPEAATAAALVVD